MSPTLRALFFVIGIIGIAFGSALVAIGPAPGESHTVARLFCLLIGSIAGSSLAMAVAGGTR